MGPDRSSVVPVPPRPRFSWDINFVPWTDRQGDQQEYARAVKKRSAFHNNLADGDSNKIRKVNRGTVLQANLYGRAKDLCDGLDDVKVASEDGVALVVSTTYKKDPLSVVPSVSDGLQNLLSLHCAWTESFPDYEPRCSAHLAR